MNYSLKELEDLELLWNIECLDCRHHTDIDVKRLIGRYGENTRADDLKPLLWCTSCKSKRTAHQVRPKNTIGYQQSEHLKPE